MQLRYMSLLSEWLIEETECSEGAAVSEQHALSFCKVVSHAHLFRTVYNMSRNGPMMCRLSISPWWIT